MTKIEGCYNKSVYDVSRSGSSIILIQGCLPTGMSCEPFRRALPILTGQKPETLRRKVLDSTNKDNKSITRWVLFFSAHFPWVRDCHHHVSIVLNLHQVRKREVLFTWTSLLWKKEILCLLFWTECEDPGRKRQLPWRHWQENQRFWSSGVYNNRGEWRDGFSPAPPGPCFN